MIEIRKMEPENKAYLNLISNRYLYAEIAVPVLKENGYVLTYHPLPNALTRECVNVEPDFYEVREVYFAQWGGRLAGQIVVVENWNRLALVWDVRVHATVRRMGVGSEMLRVAEVWARERGLRGVMLETQDTNAPACRFYEQCGYMLGGVDMCLYAGLEKQGDRQQPERALYFYKIFSPADGDRDTSATQ